MKLPIITSNVPGCKEIVEHNKSGILIPPKNKSLLKESIKKLIQNPKLAMQYGLRARERVKDKFELTLINNNILKVYKKILTNS